MLHGIEIIDLLIYHVFLAIHGSVNIPQYSNHLVIIRIFKSPPSKKMLFTTITYIYIYSSPTSLKFTRCFSTIWLFLNYADGVCFKNFPSRWGDASTGEVIFGP